MVDHEQRRSGRGLGPWRATLAAASASLVGIGLARFAYTPLIPAVIGAGWFAPAEAAYLGAANLVGYLVGALIGRPLARHAGPVNTLRAMMVVAGVAFIACAWPLPFTWFAFWRLLSGIAGGGLMVLAAPTVLPLVPAARRGLAGGIVFTGVGLGIAASGTLVPLLLSRIGLTGAWCGLGALALALTALAWTSWPKAAAGPASPAPPAADRAYPGLRPLYAAYALNAAALVPHMVFLVDYIARGLGQGLEIGGGYWVLFGIGAMLGPILAGFVGDRIGFAATWRLAFIVQIAAIGLLLVADGRLALTVSSLIVGAFVPGVVPIVLGRVHELIPESDPQRRATAWVVTTSSFAIGQAAGAYGLSFLYARTGDHLTLFAAGVGFLLLALLIDLAAARIRRGADLATVARRSADQA